MSHTTNIKINVTDLQALENACKRLGLDLKEGEFKLYSSTQVGIGVTLPGWKYPVVFNLKTGTVAYDNYNGNWGNIQELNKLVAYYGLEKAKIEARKKGYSYYESYDQNKNEICLVIEGV
jgi:hypothetical protein